MHAAHANANNIKIENKFMGKHTFQMVNGLYYIL